MTMSNEIQAVVNAVGDLPPMPVVAVKVVQLLQDPNSSAEHLAKAISRDPAVSARVLKIANSAFYSVQRQVKTLEYAIVILGEKTLKSLVLAVTLKGVSKSFGLMEKMLWEDSIGCAIGARLVAMRCRSADPEEAFLGGLFRHIGKLVMNNMDSARFAEVVQGAYNGDGTLAELEAQYFPYSHAVIGEAVLRKWNFDENLALATRHHGDVAVSRGDDPALYQLTATVNLADNFCRRLGIGRRGPDRKFPISMTPGAVALDLSSEQIDELLEEFEEVFQEDKETFLS